MSAATRSTLSWLRILVAVEWLALGAGMLVESSVADSLPEPLRSWESDLGSLGNEVALLAIMIAALGVHIGGSIAILVAWPTARTLYTSSAVALLAVLPWAGPSIVHGFSSSLYELASLVSGAVLALLHLSPRDTLPAAAPESPAPVGAIRTAALLMVGGLAGIGALAIGGGIVLYGVVVRWEHADEEARRIGAESNDAGCLEVARERVRRSDWFEFEWNFLDVCLETAAQSEAFCRDVPPLRPEEEEEGSAWAAGRCEGDPAGDACHSLYYNVQVHCAARR